MVMLPKQLSYTKNPVKHEFVENANMSTQQIHFLFCSVEKDRENILSCNSIQK